MTLRIPHLYNFNEWNGCDSISQLGASIKNYKNIMLIGNGFDIALGKNTRYQDFLLYLFIFSLFTNLKNSKPQEFKFIYCDVKKNFENQKIKFELYQTILDIVYQRVNRCDLSFGFLKNDSNFFLNLLLVIIFQERLEEVFKEFEINFRNFYSLNIFSMFRFWMPDFTSSQKQMSINFANLTIESINHFASDLNSELENHNIYGWTDIEKLIEYIVLGNDFGVDQFLSSSNLKYIFQKEIKFSGIYNYIGLSNIVYSSLLDFTDEFCFFVKNQDSLKNSSYSNFNRFNSETNNYCVDVQCNSSFADNEYDDLCFKSIISSVIDFNYTNTSENTFISKILSETCFYHVNGRASNKTAVFGYTNSNQQKVNSEAFKFEKRTQRLIKNVPSVDYETLTSKPFNLFIFGHSCSPADTDVFEPLLTSNNLNMVVVYCYSEQDKLSIYKNLCEILGYKIMDNLTRQTEKLSKRLFWAIRK